MDGMDQRLSELVEDLTTSGEPQLNPEKMKELKKICKSSEERLSHAYHLLMTQLRQEHAEVRLSAFQVVDELFARSQHFRTLVVADFQAFLELTLGTDHKQPLPPPREVARRLRQAAARAVQAWSEKFGSAYKKLALGHHFLRHSHQVDFEDVDMRTPVERRRGEEQQRHRDRLWRARAEQAVREMAETEEEVRRCLTEVDSCFQLLLPFDFGPGLPAAPPAKDVAALEEGTRDLGPEDEAQPCCSKTLCARARPPAAAVTGDPAQGAEDEDSDQEAFVRQHGLGSHKYTLDVELSADSLRVREDEDNGAILQSARDALKLIRNKFLPAVCTWLQLFTRAGTQGGHLEAAIDLKAELEAALRRSGELAIEPEGPRRMQTAPEDQDEDKEDDFVEVPEKEGYEACVPAHLWPKNGPQKDQAARGPLARMRTRLDEEACDPTSAASQLQWLRGHPPPPPRPRAALEPEEAGRLAAERARAPIVPFGADLCQWGQEQPEAREVHRPESQHRFWKPSEVDMEVDSIHALDELRTRRIPFAGTFEPVQHRCRAPRPDGQLCERQDRLKCPFHGKIIPRDDAGRPLDPEDRAREQRQQLQRQAERPDWRDPEFLRDVEAATGVDLGSARAGGRGKGKRRRHPGLTDLRQQTNTARTRIAKKIFAKAAVQRVVTAMTQMDQKKHEKFANQFNYALH
ncbi:UV-stimulated scaffold protein A isoform X1 [Rousettus aegyptiacus]|uniref:UV-stimulated scaffold protein A n=2 Tax=Rousettus aegyptiacus TaxID=9407 RepID=A0A7J8EB28_ROUAE|nr:UV-stimulated scaffold protein A isoform X1 [Rousettus aegyptiacus]KAF6432708.1 UV stimulated scaffold protein A [Rousettus aegyptiacus]